LPLGFAGPKYGTIAVGASVAIDSNASPEIVNGDAFTIDGPGLLHATKPGTATVRFRTISGVEDLEYRALAADAIDVSCPGGGAPCLMTASWDIALPFALFAGGKGGTQLVSGDLCPFVAPPAIPFRCEQDRVLVTLAGGASGTLSTRRQGNERR